MQRWPSQGETDLDSASLKLRNELLNLAELGSAYRCVVRRMRKKNGPGIADKVVKLDFTSGGVRFEVGYSFSEVERHCSCDKQRNFFCKAL